jgi:tetratricopeptide (TPR) repeat protein
MRDDAADRSLLATAQRYCDIGQPERALAALAALGPETATSAQAMWLRGYAHYELERYEQAAEVAHEGLRDEPDDIALLYLLSISELQRDDLAAAEKAILGALAIEPTDGTMLAQYADVLMHAGQLDKAGRILEHAAASEPDSTIVLQARVALAHLRHDDRQARALSEELLSRDPESTSSQGLVGSLELLRGNPRSASRRFAEVVRADPADQDAATSARLTRRMSNPLWWPVQFFQRFGAGVTWVGAVVVIFGLRALGQETLALIATAIWVFMCVTSWIGAWVFRDR